MREELVKSHKKMKHMLEDEASHPFSPFQVPSLSPAGKSSAGLLKGQARVDIVNMGDHPELIFCYKIKARRELRLHFKYYSLVSLIEKLHDKSQM